MSFVRKHVDVWDGVVLQGHPCRDTLVSYLFEGVSVHELLIASHRGGRWATRTMRVNSRELYLRIVSRQRMQASLTPKCNPSSQEGASQMQKRSGPSRSAAAVTVPGAVCRGDKTTDDSRRPTAQPVVPADPPYYGYCSAGSQCTLGGLCLRFFARFLRFA